MLDQSHRDLELVIVNGGSPEDLKSVVNRFHDDRIRYFEHEVAPDEHAVVRNWNQCLNLARGELFALLGDDDRYERDFVERMVSLRSKYNSVSIVHSRVRVIDENGRTATYSPLCPEWESGLEFLWHRVKDLRLLYICEFLFTTADLRGLGGFVDFPLAWGSDEATCFTLALRGGIAYDQRPMCNWRKSTLNISYLAQFETRLKAVKQLEQWFESFVETITPSSEDEDIILSYVKSNCGHRFENLRTDALVREARLHRSPILWAVTKGIRTNKVYGLSARVTVKVLLYLLSLHPYTRSSFDSVAN